MSNNLTSSQKHNLKKPAVAFRLEDPMLKEKLDYAVQDRSTKLSTLLSEICKEWLIREGYIEVIYK